jgi:hypothetical protein
MYNVSIQPFTQNRTVLNNNMAPNKILNDAKGAIETERKRNVLILTAWRRL